MAEYKKQAQTAPKQNVQSAQAPVVRAKIERLITDEESKVKALLDFMSGFSEKAQRSALMQVLLLLPGENGKGKS